MTKNNIVKYTIPMKNDKSISRLKKQFTEDDVTEAIIVGFTTDGEIKIYSNAMSRRDALWLLEQARIQVMS